MSLNSTRSPRKYGERNKTSHGRNERHPYAHRRERSRAPGGAVSRFSRIMVFVAPSVACARRSWIPCGRTRYARLRADRSPRTTRSVHAAPYCWRRGRPARCFRHRDRGDRRTRLGRPRRQQYGAACTDRVVLGDRSARSLAYLVRPHGIQLLRAHATDGATNTMIRENRDTAPPRALLRSRRCPYGSRSFRPCDALFRSPYFLGDRVEFNYI